jgi:hypothetical protein
LGPACHRVEASDFTELFYPFSPSDAGTDSESKQNQPVNAEKQKNKKPCKLKHK